MQTREILSIVALAALGVCLLCGLVKMVMKVPKAKQSCDHACSLLVFVAVVLVGVSQLLEEEKYMTVPPNYYYAHKGNEKRRIDQACRDCHGKKSLNELRGDIRPVPQPGGSCSLDSDCIDAPNGTCYGNKCRYPAPRPSNN